LASDTICYEDICLYADTDQDITALKSYLDDNSISYNELIYPDSTECKAALSSWCYGTDGEKVTITFPVVIYRDTRYEGPPKFFLTQYAYTTSALPADFISKAQKVG